MQVQRASVHLCIPLESRCMVQRAVSVVGVQQCLLVLQDSSMFSVCERSQECVPIVS